MSCEGVLVGWVRGVAVPREGEGGFCRGNQGCGADLGESMRNRGCGDSNVDDLCY